MSLKWHSHCLRAALYGAAKQLPSAVHRRRMALHGAARRCSALNLMLVNVHNESSNAPYGADRFCWSNRSRFDFAV